MSDINSSMSSTNSSDMPSRESIVNEVEEFTTINILEMSAHFKKLLDEKNVKYKELARKHNDLFKAIMLAYTSIRYTDEILSQVDYPEESVFVPLHKSVEFTRSQVSEVIHKYLPDESDSDGD